MPEEFPLNGFRIYKLQNTAVLLGKVPRQTKNYI